VKSSSISNYFEQVSWNLHGELFSRHLFKRFKPSCGENDSYHSRLCCLGRWTMNLWLVFMALYQFVWRNRSLFSVCFFLLVTYCRSVQFLKI